MPVELARERIAERRRSHPDASDATPELVGELTARFEAWPEATQFDGGIDAVRVCQPELLGAW